MDLPNEIQYHILSNVNSVIDIRSCILTCALWREIMKDLNEQYTRNFTEYGYKKICVLRENCILTRRLCGDLSTNYPRYVIDLIDGNDILRVSFNSSYLDMILYCEEKFIRSLTDILTEAWGITPVVSIRCNSILAELHPYQVSIYADIVCISDKKATFFDSAPISFERYIGIEVRTFMDITSNVLKRFFG